MQTILCLLLLSLSLMSCAINDCPRYNKPKGKCRRGKAKSFLAFNARLLSSVPNKDDRLKELSGALLTENADVVCLNQIAGRTIVCTNLQTALNDEYYEPETKTIFSTWAEENLKQAECILENFRRQEKVILMGDLECGPEIPSNGIRKEHLPSYNALTTQFVSPYARTVGLQTSRGAKIITTHVMMKGYSSRITCSRVLDTYNGTELSLGYGVKCML